MLLYFYVGVGGALGSILRFWLSNLVVGRFGETLPWGTLFVNVTGSFLIGFFAAATGSGGRWLVSPAGRVFFMAGICGGYTTFSSFSLQTLGLVQKGEWFFAALNALFSFVLCLAAVWLGFAAARFLNLSKAA
jgi:fluoride exporter